MTRELVRVGVFAAGLALTGLVAPSARAGDAETAEALFQSGREAMAKGDLAAACPRLAESQRLDPAAGTLLNLAECEERAGKLASALAHFQEAHDELPPGDYRVAFSSQRIKKLAPRVPRLVVRVTGPAPTGLTVLRDGTALGPASLGVALPVDLGMHVCVLRVPGHVDATQEITLAEGETKTLELTPGAAALAGDEKSAGSWGAQKTWGIVLGTAGLAGLVAGGIFGVTSKLTYDSAESHCAHVPTGCSSAGTSGSQSAYTQAAVSDIGFVAGAALVVAGGALYFTAPKEGRATVTPAVGAHEAGLRVAGTF